MNTTKEPYIIKGLSRPNVMDVLEIIFTTIFFISSMYAGFYIFAVLCGMYICYSIFQIRKKRKNQNSFIKLDMFKIHVFDALTSEDYDIQWKNIEKVIICKERLPRTSVNVLKIFLKHEKYSLDFVMDNYKYNLNDFCESLLSYNPSLNLEHS